MSHAHQHGIIHRDLKPANILLKLEDRGGAMRADRSALFSSSFVPKIADFGLAKLTTGGINQTRSGSVLGTPAYMAPEQAAGRTREISTAVDVHALGAILYELLTGRSPFRGDTIAETLQHVITQEPIAPRRLVPTVPRDLETICLKCLAKEPLKRYAGAQDLADDLRRFLANEPIRARPLGTPALVWKWAWRNPAAAALLVVIALSGTGMVAGSLWYQGDH
jgi:serine/threonine protein kinase